MMAQLLCRFKRSASGLLTSQLYNEQTFYPAFERDLACCRNEAVIESPFLTTRTIRTLLPILRKMVSRGMEIPFTGDRHLPFWNNSDEGAIVAWPHRSTSSGCNFCEQ